MQIIKQAKAIATTFAFFAVMTVANAASADGVETRVRGTVTSLTGTDLLVKSREGSSVPITLKPDWKVVGIGKASVSDIKVGDFVGIASLPTVDGGDGALEVLIFPAALKGTGEGSYAWDLQPKSSMTNATVSKAVKAVDGSTVTLTYQGKDKTITVTDNTPVVTFADATNADVKSGATVFVPGQKSPNGTISSGLVIVGTNGVVPPM